MIKAKKQGHKIIGYFAGGYLPEKLVSACDATPLCFLQAGNNTILKKETGLPMLVLESEYEAMETGPMKTRIEAFLEIIRR